MVGKEEQGSGVRDTQTWVSRTERTLRRRGRRPHWRCLPEGPRLRGDRQRRQSGAVSRPRRAVIREPNESPAERVSLGEEEQGSAAQLSPSGGSGAKRTLRRRGRRPDRRCLPEGPRFCGDRQRRQPGVRSAARDSEKRRAVGGVPPQSGLCGDEFARLVCKRSLDSRLL